MKNVLKDSKLKYTRVEVVYSNIMVMSAVKLIRNGLFHTSIGEVNLDIQLTSVIVESKRGKAEYLCGSTLTDARIMANKLKQKKVAMEDIGSFVELHCNYASIDNAIEQCIAKQTKEKDTKAV